MGQVILVDFKKKQVLEVVERQADEHTCHHCGGYALANSCCFACYDDLPTAAELLIVHEDNLSCGELSPLPSQ